MNKKLVMGSVLGLVAVGAGAFALSGLGGGSEETPARQARAENKGSTYEPYVFESEGGYFPSLGDGKVVKLADPVGLAPSKNDSAPSTTGGPTVAQPQAEQDELGEPADDDDVAGTGAGSTENQDLPTMPDSEQDDDDAGAADGTGIINNPDLTDAICELIGCNEPTITPPPGLADSICDLVGCDEEPGTIQPDIKPCQLVGNCAPPPIIHKDLGLGGLKMRP